MSGIEEVKPNFFVKANSKGVYRRVYPLKKNLNEPLSFRNLNWKHLLLVNWKQTLVVLLIVLVAGYGYWNDTRACREFEKNPYKYCLALNFPNLKTFQEDQDKEEVFIGFENSTFNYTKEFDKE